jgi:hypothetical protein
VLLGAVTNFFDTLGIGSFAPTTAWLKLRRMIPDSFMPATLNAGHALPTVAQALIFITLVKVDPWLLAGCIAAAVAGAVVGAPIVTRLPVRAVQAVVGLALLIAAGLYAMLVERLAPGWWLPAIALAALALAVWLCRPAASHLLAPVTAPRWLERRLWRQTTPGQSG